MEECCHLGFAALATLASQAGCYGDPDARSEQQGPICVGGAAEWQIRNEGYDAISPDALVTKREWAQSAKDSKLTH